MAAARSDGDGPVRLSFVCLGNICRSPTAAAIMTEKVRAAGLEDRIQVESAGTGDWHVGEGADRRAMAEARRRGLPMEHCARQVDRDDFARLDLVLAMDRENLANLHRIAPDDAARAKIHLLREFDPTAPAGAEVPDPYFGGDEGFRDAFDLVDRACEGLLEHLRAGPLAG